MSAEQTLTRATRAADTATNPGASPGGPRRDPLLPEETQTGRVQGLAGPAAAAGAGVDAGTVPAAKPRSPCRAASQLSLGDPSPTNLCARAEFP